MEDLGLQPGQQSKGLRIALESPYVGGQRGQGTLAVMAKGRVTQIMGQASAVHHVGIAAQHGPDLPSDLGHLQGMCQSRTGKVVSTGDQDLRLGSQPTQRRRMDQTRSVPFKSGPAAGLWWLWGPPFLVPGGVDLGQQA